MHYGLIAFSISRQETPDMVYLLPFGSVFVSFNFYCLFVYLFLLLLSLTQQVCSNTKTGFSCCRLAAGVRGASSTKKSYFQIK